MSELAKAYCWDNGVIEFGETVPEGALGLGDGPKEWLRDCVAAWGRLAYDNETWLVPGVPEAEDQGAALGAVIAFRGRLMAWRSAPGIFISAPHAP